MKPLETNTVVVGAGIIGTAIAERLCHEGHEVLLIDRQAPGEGCSKGHAGHFATDVVLPLANLKTIITIPRMLLDPLGPLSIRWSYLPRMLPWITRFIWAALPANARASATALRALNRHSIENYDLLLARTGLQWLMTKRGALTVYQTLKGQQQHRATVQLLRDYGVIIEELSGDAVREAEPAMSGAVVGGLYFPNTAHTINPLKLVHALANSFSQRGGRIMQAEVTGISNEPDGRVCLQTSTGVIRAQRLVIATGAWSKSLARMLGYHVPLDTERGYHLMLPEPAVDLTRPITAFERSFVMTPMEEGLRLAGTVELAGLEAPANNRRADILFDHASSLLPGLQRGAATRWMGLRPSLPDSLPVIGRAPAHPQVYFAFGHQHLGLTQAATTADLIADLFAGNTPSIDLTPFRVDRFF